VSPQHHYSEDQKRAEAILYYAVHLAFEKTPDSTFTLADLRAAAKCLIENAGCSMTTRRFYDAILVADEAAFYLLKAFVYPIRRPRQISLYSFAIRLFLDAVAGEELKVCIYKDGSTEPSATLDAQTFLDQEIREQLLEKPRFEEIGQFPGQWAIPLSRFIGVELSGKLRMQKVSVRSVDLVNVRVGGVCRVVCPLICPDSPDDLSKVRAMLMAEPRLDGSSFNEVLLRLVEARKNSAGGFDWLVTDDNQLIFSIGRTE
jgi:hypothetical protein